MSNAFAFYDLGPGSELAGFTIVSSHRQGGFSTAFEATDSKGERCELQIFPAALFEGRAQVGEFTERLLPWKGVRHDAVLSVREVVAIDAENLVLVMDYPEGESLRARLNRETRLDETTVKAVALQLLGGLEAIHAAGVVHGDIKPYTIHVEGEGAEATALLVDGGVTPGLWTAKGLGEKTALIGTPYYAPVEQFGGDAPDVRSDIYNLATVFYECLVGALPWKGTSFLEVFQAKLEDPPPFRTRWAESEVAGDLEEVIRRGCLADRRKRYESAAEFREALAACG